MRARVCVFVCARACVCVCVLVREWVCARVFARAHVPVSAHARVHHGPAALGEPRVVEQRDDPRERRACAMGEPPSITP